MLWGKKHDRTRSQHALGGGVRGLDVGVLAVVESSAWLVVFAGPLMVSPRAPPVGVCVCAAPSTGEYSENIRRAGAAIYGEMCTVVSRGRAE